jgi:uncharacterized protein with von Willebrand factor type A (vWA) domain
MEKQIIASILFIFCYGCVNSQTFKFDSSDYKVISSGKIDTTFLNFTTTIQKRAEVKDTVRVLMLVSDTGHVFKIDGFEERFKECCINGKNSQYTVYKPEPYYTHIRYLDLDKKELKESIVVWISKEIKK